MLSQKCIKKRLSVAGERVRYSAVLHLARSICVRSNVENVPMAMVTAYFDESDSAQFSTVAGVVSTADKWRGFETDWRKMLDKYKISALHMKDFVHSNGEFSGWKGDEPKRKQFVSRIVEILSRRCMNCPGMVVNRSIFARTLAADPFISTLYTDEYTTASFMSLLLIGKWAVSCGFTDPIGYVFDRGNGKRLQFQRAYDRLIQNEKECKISRVGTLSFGDDTQILPLQAADFIAYEFNKVCTDLGGGTRRVRGSLRAIFDRVPTDCRVPNEKNLAKLVRDINDPATVWED